MRRRDFLATAAVASVAPSILARRGWGDSHAQHAQQHHDKTIHATPADAMKAPRETLAFLPCIRVGMEGEATKKPDYLAVVDVDPHSDSYSKVVARLDMPHVGDELHHYGWNACASCHGERERRYLIVPGLASSRIHVIDVADPRKPKLQKVVSAEEVKKTGLSAPHTVHCLSDGRLMLSMLGDADGNAPGGFLLLDDEFNVAGRWEKNENDAPDMRVRPPKPGMKFNYDFWYQPRHNAMISSEWAAPNTVRQGFKVEDVKAGKYGQRLVVWNWEKQTIDHTIDLGAEGLIPLEVRFHHNPDSAHGFVGAALSSSMWHFHKAAGDANQSAKPGRWTAEKVIQVDPVEVEGWPFPVPGLITDLVLSMDDRWLYFSNWLHGDIRQYDVSDPAKPKLTGQVWLGGVLGAKGGTKPDAGYVGGPQMLQLSLDGKRLYVTSSLYSVWDNQFYPDMAKRGSFLRQIDCDTTKGGLALNEKFHVDFGQEPGGPSRAHEIRFPGGDSTSDIWV
ncbi:MAG: selenium-binding protein [Planctomycetota bacterium]|nr:MAG: selenium-binding protein [Planctomycetota bacterium]